MTSFIAVSLISLLFTMACFLVPLWRPDYRNQYLILGTALIFLIPIGLGALYAVVGEPRAIDRTPDASDQLRGQLIEIANELERDPSNQDNWFALGMAYKNIESYSAAEHALRRALYIDNENPAFKVELAETLIFANAGTAPPEADALLDEALTTDPAQQKALWLKGVVAFTRRDFDLAIGHWQTLLAQLPVDAPVVQSIERQIALAQTQFAQAQSGEVRSGRVIDLSVDIAPDLRQTLNGEETVFVIAQAVDGPSTPLAARRLSVNDLPITLTITDADAMIEGMTISSAADIQLTARVSLGNDVAPKPGDLEGRVVVGPSTEAQIIIRDKLQ